MIIQQHADVIIHHAVNFHREPPMVSICAWCPDAQERTRKAHVAGYATTHTICPTCEAFWRECAGDPRR